MPHGLCLLPLVKTGDLRSEAELVHPEAAGSLSPEPVSFSFMTRLFFFVTSDKRAAAQCSN